MSDTSHRISFERAQSAYDSMTPPESRDDPTFADLPKHVQNEVDDRALATDGAEMIQKLMATDATEMDNAARFILLSRLQSDLREARDNMIGGMLDRNELLWTAEGWDIT